MIGCGQHEQDAARGGSETTGNHKVKNVGLVLKEGLSHRWTDPKPQWSALGYNELPITGVNQGKLLNHAQEAWSGNWRGKGLERIGVGGVQNFFLSDSKIR